MDLATLERALGECRPRRAAARRPCVPCVPTDEPGSSGVEPISFINRARLRGTGCVFYLPQAPIAQVTVSVLRVAGGASDRGHTLGSPYPCTTDRGRLALMTSDQ